ncbi:MAG: hypothetical protein D3M94_17295 [Rhodocyclales bacterium GT-UBC]|nr:MAG: hypothetical protein D3M94_17295 [Rhodocyclales bacterium GT-UBC]
MTFPDFFADIAPITLRDPLAELLGAARGGLIEYRFADAVKLAGHSCPTVAGAWLMTTRGLRALYGDAVPVRGDLLAALPEAAEVGVSGVIASVVTLLTGATGEQGFKGLAGRHARNGLLRFGTGGSGSLRLTRCDTQAAVECALHLERVPPDPAMGPLLYAVLDGSANAEQRERFGELWQERVRRLLVEHAEDPALVEVRAIHA